MQKKKFILIISLVFLFSLCHFCDGANITEITTDSRADIISTAISTPIITIYSPVDNYVSAPGTIIFNYSVNDSNIIKNCSLIIGGAIIDTHYDPFLDIPYTFNSTLVAGTYTWNIICYNYANISRESANRTMTIGFEDEEEEEHKRTSTGFRQEAINYTKICIEDVNNEGLTFFVNDKKIGLEEVSFFYEGRAKDACLIVKEMNVEQISGIMGYPLEKSYKAFKIETTGFNFSKISEIMLKISISEKWLNFRDSERVFLYNNKEITKDGWTKITMSSPFSDLVTNSYSYFFGKTDDFGIFLTTANMKEYKPVCGDHVCDSQNGENEENCPQDCKTNCKFLGIQGGLFGMCWYGYAIISILIAGIIWIYIRKYKNGKINNKKY